ncbi:GroES-like protein [Apiospora aurea]|uniref:GroES-like protein n=1 Tax=Apiospora aurea TaxID=335848 RepID=A0ABR1QZ67_9PEZI
MAAHLAAASPAKGQPLELQTRPTPNPGPGELLVLVKSVALNPADGLMRDLGLFTSTYPTVTGFDMAGLVLEVGDGVPTSPADGAPGLCFQPGVTRVAAHSASYWNSVAPDYGVFQEKCLVPWQHAAATLPVATVVALNAWETLGLTVPVPKSGIAPTQPKQNKKTREAVLIWGASSSVGTMGVQTAALMREDRDSPIAAVYATSGPANAACVRSLGADRVFDYKDPGVVDAIVAAAREDGVVVRRCFLAMGQLELCQAVLKAFVGDVEGKAVIGSAPLLPQDAEVVEGVETVFLVPSSEEEVRLRQFRSWMGTWLRESLGKGLIKPSPEPKVVGKGLGDINAGLDMVLQGVSCTKLVVEVRQQ